MKKIKNKKNKKEPELTREQIQKKLEAAGFVFVHSKNKNKFGKPDEQLNRGPTIIIDELGRKITV